MHGRDKGRHHRKICHMGATIDHVGIPATDPEAAGTFLAWVLGEGDVVPDGPPGDDSGDMFSLVLDGWSLAFVRAPQPAPLHLAIRVAPETFTDAIERLTGRGIAFGNDPEDTANGRTDDPLGGAGRAYFTDPDGHLYELVVVPAG
jgi:catechol 2,3-dioxygenase-like lactoylglutathione lyase family enzyme